MPFSNISVNRNKTKISTYNATLSNGLIIALEFYKACCNVEVARILYCQSHIAVLPKQLEHEVVSQICYGLEDEKKRKKKLA